MSKGLLKNIQKHGALLVVIASAFLLSACASGPSYNQVKNTFPEIAADKGRIFFYRDGSLVGGGIQPSIRLDGKVVGDSVPGTVFFRDTKPGTHDVSVTTEVLSSTSVELSAQQTQYVKFRVGWGFFWRIHPRPVSPTQGLKEIQNLVYTGGKKPDSSTEDQ
jgi:hypothetical protein